VGVRAPEPVLGYLGLGSNEGDRLGALRAVPVALERRGVRVIEASSVWRTAPQGEVLEQPDFMNACLAVQTRPAPDALVTVCKEVEREGGRIPGGPKHGPRPIDVDVLLLGDLEHSSELLVLPHPEIATRRFVLEPLLELDPGLRLPDGTALAPMLDRVSDQVVSRLGPLSRG